MYLEYDKYKELGGTLNETAFTQHEIEIEAKLDYLTNGRIKRLSTIPNAVINLCFRLHTSFWEATNIDQAQNLTSYSNGIESFGYNATDNQGKSVVNTQIIQLMNEYLWEYPQLLYRGRNQWKQKR